MVRKVVQSFYFALGGLVYTLKTQRNMRIHFGAAVLVLLAGPFFRLSGIETLLLFLAVFLVIITELINTAVEKTVDLFTENFHPLAEIAKNTAAGAVLVAAVNSVVVGIVVFADKFLTFRVGVFSWMMIVIAALLAAVFVVSMRIKS